LVAYIKGGKWAEGFREQCVEQNISPSEERGKRGVEKGA